MNLFVNQKIIIHELRVQGITNSSVLQIGSSGVIKPLSNLYNTGAFSEPAIQLSTVTPDVEVLLPPPS
ncbi:spore gernimation protein KA [Pueribacillus theae]|uniref:Spore gernimation protein KA n=1 Tax=Pueribacillus theae TaxID=2171751 RepID=A0A2U1JVN0_9BACI|nr:spore germination protein GerPB [Pueribacillus theae]PWA09035.1 spore gernimation protein KA [Pueribacillus theae]